MSKSINIDARTFNKAVKKMIPVKFPKIKSYKRTNKTVALKNEAGTVVGYWEPTLMAGSRIVICSWY